MYVQDTPKNLILESHNQPLRLDTITSQSEIEPAHTDTDDIMKYVPVNQPLRKLKEGNNSGSSFSPIDPKIAEISQTPDETRPNSASSELSFITPFGKTTNTNSAKDIFNQIKQPHQDMDFDNPFSRQKPPTNNTEQKAKALKDLQDLPLCEEETHFEVLHCSTEPRVQHM